MFSDFSFRISSFCWFCFLFVHSLSLKTIRTPRPLSSSDPEVNTGDLPMSNVSVLLRTWFSSFSKVCKTLGWNSFESPRDLSPLDGMRFSEGLLFYLEDTPFYRSRRLQKYVLWTVD